MHTFKKYQRTQVGELRPVTEVELLRGIDESLISVSHADKVNGSPRKGDMIARNPDNHEDQWLVSKEYFEKNFSLMRPCIGTVSMEDLESRGYDVSQVTEEQLIKVADKMQDSLLDSSDFWVHLDAACLYHNIPGKDGA